ncbi:MAG: alpha-amylase family glycosyl hydrolase [Anaerolineales bacterium]
MTKKYLLTLLLLLFISSCASPTPTVAPPPTASPTALADSDQWWSKAVFYEIFVRSFNDSNNDGIGDFNGITQKLDYLQQLGITAIWLMPIFPSPSYHGYDVTDYYNVNPQYGTMDDFKNLVKEAHNRNIHIIIDLVINHTSDKHPWFKDAKKDPKSPYRDWYIWSETDPKYNGPWGERVWHSSTTGFYYGIFEAFMPDLNYKNPAVTAEMNKIVAFWLKEVGVDGFRLDAAKHLIEEGTVQQNTNSTHLWYQNEFYPAYKSINPNAMTVGEVFGDGLNTIAGYIKNDQFDLAFNFQLANDFLKSANTGKASYLPPVLALSEKAIPNHQYATFLTNHDQNRSMSQLNGDINKAKLAAFFLFTSPGTPFIYYGEEIGMQGKKPDEDIRRPMQWSGEANAGFTTGKPWRAPATDYTTVNVTEETGNPDSLVEHYRALIKLRNSNSALQTGDIVPLKASDPSIYSAIRKDSTGTFLILANLKDEPITDYNIALDGISLAGTSYSVETVFGAGQANSLERSGESFKSYRPFDQLPPYAMYVLKLNPK